MRTCVNLNSVEIKCATGYEAVPYLQGRELS
jgi:hypothetical protein